jgi:hypothetical protein
LVLLLRIAKVLLFSDNQSFMYVSLHFHIHFFGGGVVDYYSGVCRTSVVPLS